MLYNSSISVSDTEEESSASPDNSRSDDNKTLDHNSPRAILRRVSQWKVDYNVRNLTLNALLKILRDIKPYFPKDSRTLVPPPNNIQLQVLAGGEYYHFGIAQAVAFALRDDQDEIRDGSQVPVQLNVDGLPVHRSSNGQLWPILGLLQHREGTKPFVIGLYFGNSKPSSADAFLTPFIDDYNRVRATGVMVHGMDITVTISTVICDAPAKAFLKCIKYHNAYSACDKCDEHGVWRGRTVLPALDGTLRTDASFAGRVDAQHHDGDSPFERIGIGEFVVRKQRYNGATCLVYQRSDFLFQYFSLWIYFRLPVTLFAPINLLFF